MRTPEPGQKYDAFLRERLPAKSLTRLRRIARLAQKRGEDPYLVGGCVRDLFLDRDVVDLDVGIVGNALELAKEAQNAFSCDARYHEAFYTAALIFPDGQKIDLASARRDVYRRPAALPSVTPADFSSDLARRDFTVNTLALKLGAAEFGLLVDLWNGARDLKHRVLRVLYKRSFIDDPTRIIRGARFEVRFGFRFDEGTETLARESAYKLYPRMLSRARLKAELYRTVDEPDPVPVFVRLADLGVLEAYHRDMLRLKASRDALEKLGAALGKKQDLGPRKNAARVDARAARGFVGRCGAGSPRRDRRQGRPGRRVSSRSRVDSLGRANTIGTRLAGQRGRPRA
ncbi:MAG: hypothetical protein M5R36_01550 [Deltaproteobacteria bacterium]|nr:hypothetical protein [Deltaproteobacteria bacterium]